MKLKPILFGTEMVQAIFKGHKTQTRRVVKPQPPQDCEDTDPCIDFCDYDHQKGFQNCYVSWETKLHPDGFHTVVSPYGKKGDVLWVRESFYEVKEGEGGDSLFIYKADKSFPMSKWTPSIHMPKNAARIFLEITNIRIERLQDISGVDAIAEGIDTTIHENFAKPQNFFNYMDPLGPPLISAYDSFISLWESINGEFSADNNPWVWVVEFKQIKKPINFK